ncbi:MAG TPA: hemerythrin domain-containing protein [Acidimicrobiales bacterium]|nr:hemerythrin domain-containing protein [Acidimicrobiales bacterium]
MTADQADLTDVRDMYSVHEGFRRGLRDAPGQVASVRDGETERALRFADYLGELLWLLHVHHSSEDELLYPLLVERAPEHRELFSRMDAQHLAITPSLEAAQYAAKRFGITGSVADGRALADACESLLETLDVHLSQEEEEVLPIAARVISPAEWGALPAHALSQYSGTRVWLPFGLATEAMPADLLEEMRSQLPPPVSAMWFGGGSDAFAAEMALVRGGTA